MGMEEKNRRNYCKYFSGLKLFIVSIVSFILNGDISIILYDGVRGAIIVVLAVVLFKKINFIKISEVSK